MMPAGLRAALGAELLKARRSRVLPATFLVLLFIPLAGALFIVIVEDPQRARDLGLIGAKAQLSGITPDWPGLLTFATQAVVAMALLLDAFVLTWLFGREFADGTARYLMALPVSRRVIVTAKYAVYALWAVLLIVWLAVVTVLVGMAMRLPGGSLHLVADAMARMLGAGLLTVLAVTPIGYVASRARGYLAALASGVGLIVVAQIGAGLGWAAEVPWAVPALAAGVVPGQQASPVSLLLVMAAGLLGIGATVRWWRGPDAGL